MATPRKTAGNRPKAKKTARPAAARPMKATKKVAPTAKVVAKPAEKLAAKPQPKLAVKPALVGKAVTAKAGKAPKPPKPPAVVRPLGVLPPESISRATHKPARPLPIPKPAPRAAKARKDGAEDAIQGVTAQDFQEFEQRLLEERARVLKEMGHYEATVLKVNPRDSAGDLSGYSFHMADVGTDAMEREKAFQLASAEGRILMEINEALRRMARGEYGVCESCGNPILRARLEAMPTARLCLACKEKEERLARGGS
jgi:RNA polymerase-binding protein DksA